MVKHAVNVSCCFVIGKHFGNFCSLLLLLRLLLLCLLSSFRGCGGQVNWRGVVLKNFMVIILDAVVFFGEGGSVVVKNVVCRSHRLQMLPIDVVAMRMMGIGRNRLTHCVVVGGSWLFVMVHDGLVVRRSVVARLVHMLRVVLATIIVVN